MKRKCLHCAGQGVIQMKQNRMRDGIENEHCRECGGTGEKDYYFPSRLKGTLVSPLDGDEIEW